MNGLIVLGFSAVIIGGILWWFFGNHKVSEVASNVVGKEQVVHILVDGGYKPAVVNLKLGIPARLVFTRKDPSGCLEEVILPGFGKQAHLPVGKPYDIMIDPSQAGEFQYSCGMRMFFGKVVVK